MCSFFLRSEKDLIYRVGTCRELSRVATQLPEEIVTAAAGYLRVLDAAYGPVRNWSSVGGYVAIAETCEEGLRLQEELDTAHRVCEWVQPVGNRFLAALYLLGDDYSIVMMLPMEAAPMELKNMMEEQQ